MAHNNKKPGFSNKAASPASPAAKSSSNYSFATEPKQKKTSMRLPSWFWMTVTPLIIAATGFYYLFTKNSDVLYMAQDRSFFSFDQSFLTQCLLQPEGMVLYVSSYLTQLFYNPIVGTIALLAIWIASFFISKKAFGVPSSLAGILAVPSAALLLGIIGVGYWLYYIKQPGYWFASSVGYLLSVAIVLVHRMLYDGAKGNAAKIVIPAVWVLIAAANYFYIGWFSLLALAYIAVNSFFMWRNSQERNITTLAAGIAIPIIAAVAMPFIGYYFFNEIRQEDLWMCGMPRFEQGLSDGDLSVNDTMQTIPYIILAATPLLFPILSILKNKVNAVMSLCINIAVFVVLGLWINERQYDDYNFKTECRMYEAAIENDWDKVLSEMTGLPDDATREMVLLKNIALFNKGNIGEQMFKYNNMGRNPYVPDTIAITPHLDENGEQKLIDGKPLNDTIMLHPHLVQTAAPLIYYHHGKTNFSYRWLIENMVEYGPKNGDIQLLAMNSLVNGEMEVAKKYLTLLQSTPNYKEWADRYMPITSTPSKIKDFHEFDHICELRDNMGTTLDGDNGLPEMYLISYFANTMNKDNAYLQEMTLVYSLVNKDIQLFWPRFFLYAQMHKDVKSMPRHYQEAAYLYGNLEHSVDISRLPFDKEVITSYQSFQSTSQQLMQTQQRLTGKIDEVQVANEMKELYGDTFYWFYFFCRGVHSY